MISRASCASINVSLPLDAAVESLSIARCQLVAICRALAQDARLIIMDEPTASLTHQEVEGLLHVASDGERFHGGIQRQRDVNTAHRLLRTASQFAAPHQHAAMIVVYSNVLPGRTLL